MKTQLTNTGLAPELIRQIQETFRNHGVRKAVLFGSRARGDYKDTSDIDIAYWGSEAVDAALWQDFYELPTIHTIDLVSFETIANPAFRQNILRDALTIISA